MMKKLIPFILAGVILAGCGTDEVKDGDQENGNHVEHNEMEDGEMKAAITKKDSTYEYSVKNETDKEMTFTFTSGQTIDFELKDTDGKVVYKDSENKMYTQAIREKTIAPGDALAQEIKLPDLPAGTYTLSAWLTAKGSDEYKVTEEIELP
jgi:Intracellular proteinase inhibitor